MGVSGSSSRIRPFKNDASGERAKEVQSQKLPVTYFRLRKETSPCVLTTNNWIGSQDKNTSLPNSPAHFNVVYWSEVLKEKVKLDAQLATASCTYPFAVQARCRVLCPAN